MKALSLSILLAAVSAGAALAQAAPAPRPETVPSSFAFEEICTLGPLSVVGPTPIGVRQRIPITGGVFSGPGISGHILPGGADWQLKRTDDSMVIDADYMIETDDHVQIHVHNVGVVTRGDGTRKAYHWAAPSFEAPNGKYGWLNDSLFVSTLGPAGDKDHPAVKITIYKID